jgi:hypothetical protein
MGTQAKIAEKSETPLIDRRRARPPWGWRGSIAAGALEGAMAGGITLR